MGKASRSRAPRPRAFKVFGHTSEIGLEIIGRDLSELFKNAALGLLSLYGISPSRGGSQIKLVSIRAADAEETLVQWLNELVYFVGTRRWVFSDISFHRAEPNHLLAELKGEPSSQEKLPLSREIKAATRYQLRIQREGNHLAAKVVFDV